VPTWAAILVGVASGLGSGLVGTLLTIGHERAAEMRTRLLTAAEEFVRAAEACRKAIRDARAEPSESTYNLVRDRYDDLVPTVTLVELLYGFSSRPSLRAKGVGSAFIDARDELAKGHSRDEAVIEEALRDFGESLTIFGEAAADQVRRGWLRRRLRPLPPGLPSVPNDW
jgi:GNAT superfamily N-acetyltransferase